MLRCQLHNFAVQGRGNRGGGGGGQWGQLAPNLVALGAPRATKLSACLPNFGLRPPPNFGEVCQYKKRLFLAIS